MLIIKFPDSNQEIQRSLGNIVPLLLRWYDKNARVLPWRENTDPYRVWVSEIMLQQTQVETVKPYFERFIRQLPDIQSLASADEAQLMKLWEGLGYYSRMRNLQKASRVIVEAHGGVFPGNYDDIRALPGIGDYTAGAIASIAFGQPVPAVDGNVLRVMARLTGDGRDIRDAKVKTETAALLRTVYPATRCGDFTQSLMELGATVCVPKSPRCDRCPLRAMCRAFETCAQDALPFVSKKPPRKKELKTVLLLRFGQKVALRRRPENVLLGGLWEFPNVDGHLDGKAVEQLLRQWRIPFSGITKGIHKKHVFTHIEWEMTSYVVICEAAAGDFIWVTRDTLTNELALPSAFQAFTETAFARNDEETMPCDSKLD